MTILDTHAWIWLATASKKLSRKAQQAIADEPRLGVATISCWEVAMLVHKNRIKLDRDVLVWIKQALALPKIEPVPLDPEIAVKAAAFENSFPGDPADRLIVATAIIRKASLISKDRLIKKAKVLPVVW